MSLRENHGRHTRLRLRLFRDDFLQIDDPGLGIQLAQDLVSPAGGSDTSDPRVRILDIAEDDRVRRTGLRARGHDLAIHHATILELRISLGTTDPLHAEGALLHDTFLADQNIWVQLPVQWHRALLGVPVVVTDLVRALDSTVKGADTSVVELGIQSIRGVIRSVDRRVELSERVRSLIKES